MAMNHIAIVRSSARMAQQKASESTSKEPSIVSEQSIDASINELSQMSVISLSSDQGGDYLRDANRRRRSHTSASFGESSSRATKSTNAVTKPVMAPLEPMENISDIEVCVDDELRQLNVLNNLEQRLKAIASNVNEVVNHLRECSNQVTEASVGCLEALVKAIDLTCDKADGEMKAFYHTITKCDELTTKLSAASSFCGEVKTLRKSIETLDNLYKSRPHSKIQ